MKQWRATYYVPNGKSTTKDFFAKDKDAAWSTAYDSDMRVYGYTNVMLQEIKEGLKQIGLEVEISVDESRCHRGFLVVKNTDYVFIKANSESDARDIYNRDYKGHWCDHNGNLDEDGYLKYGRIKRTYYC